MDEYSKNKAIYIKFKQLTSCTYHIINIYIYLYYMHIKDYLTRLENKSKRQINTEPDDT
jgi:hypothetical protein